MSATAFGATLQAIRRSRQLSQANLSFDADISPSYVNRLESGERAPSRAMVLALADALDATDAERDALLSAAGFRPFALETQHLVVRELNDLLSDETICAEHREDVRNMTALLIRQARRAVAA